MPAERWVQANAGIVHAMENDPDTTIIELVLVLLFLWLLQHYPGLILCGISLFIVYSVFQYCITLCIR